MQNLRPSNIKVIFQRPSCGSPIAVASGFIASIAPVGPTEVPFVILTRNQAGAWIRSPLSVIRDSVLSCFVYRVQL